MPRIKEFIKNNYVLSTVFLVILIVCIASGIIIHLINTFRPYVDVKNVDGAYYQVIGKDIKSFDATVRKENDIIKEIIPSNYSLISLSPVYYSNEDKILLKEDSIIVFYEQGFKDYRVNRYSEVSYEDGNSYIIINGRKYLTNNYFMYDLNGNYVFMDEVTLKYNGKSVKLSPFSFVNASISGLTYYNYETKEVVDVDKDITSAFIIFDNFNIDLLKNVTIKNSNTKILRNNASALKPYKEA